MKSERLCCVVDAYSAGSLLAGAFAKYGFKSVHVQSRADLHQSYLRKFRKEDFVENLTFTGDLNSLVSKLKELRPEVLLAGSEIGVNLADQLRHHLSLFPNDISLTRARRNKYEMIERLRPCGVNAVDQIKAEKAQTILDWANKRNEWPIVIKPPESAGTEDVSICNNGEEALRAFNNVYNKVNHMGSVNAFVLAQGFLKGEEYIVNTVSWDGQHYLSDIWHVAKTVVPGAGRIYDYCLLQSPNGEKELSLKEYIFKVLDALGIKYGPAHNEIMLTEKGPYLIESNSRIDGFNIYNNKKEIKCLDANQLELTVEAFADPNNFLKRIGRANSVHKYALEVYFVSKIAGRFKSFGRMGEIEGLESFWEFQPKLKNGDKIERTIDLMTLPGTIWLAHDNKDLLMDDYRRVREIEKEGFYIVE